jgi:hypothetical protein
MPFGTSWLAALISRIQNLAYAGLKPGMRPSDMQPLTAKQKAMRFGALCAVAIILAGGVYWIAGIRGRNAEAGFSVENLTGVVSPRDVELTGLAIDFDAKPVVISGYVKNASERSYSRVEITFTLTDANGSQIGAHTVTVPGVAAKATVPFRAAIEIPNVAYYVVRDVIAY